MAAEFYLHFEPKSWCMNHQNLIKNMMQALLGYQLITPNIVHLKATTVQENAWQYDVRMFFLEYTILFEISARNEQLVTALHAFFMCLRQQVKMQIMDEDGVISSW